MPSIVPPAFQFYARDWIASSTRAMSLAARGAYTDLLAFSWLEDGLPVDPDKLRRLVGADVDEWAAIWPNIEHAWPIVDDRRRNPRQESERVALSEFKEQCSRGGKRSAEVRTAQFGTAQPSGPPKGGSKGVRMPVRTEPRSGSEPKTEPKTEPSPNTAICDLRTSTASTEITQSVISVARADPPPPVAVIPRLAPVTRAELCADTPRDALLEHWRAVSERYGVLLPLKWSEKAPSQADGLLEIHPLDVLRSAVVAFWDSPEFHGKRNFGMFASQAGQLVAHVRSGAIAPFGAKAVPRAGVHGSKTTQNAASLAAFVENTRRRAAP